MNDSLAKNVELQFINGTAPGGAVLPGRRGRQHPGHPGGAAGPLETGKTASFSGRDPLTGESILAVSSPVFYNGAVVGVVRFVTSTRLLDQQLVADGAGDGRRHRGGDLPGLSCPTCIFIHNVVRAGGGGVPRPPSASPPAATASRSTTNMTTRSGELVGHHQRHVPEDQPEREDADGVHLLRVPRAAHPPDRHQRLGRDPAERTRPATRRRLRRGMRIIVKEAHRLTNMVEELLEFSRMQDGRFTLPGGGHGPAGGVGGRHLYLSGAVPPGGHRAELSTATEELSPSPSPATRSG